MKRETLFDGTLHYFVNLQCLSIVVCLSTHGATLWHGEDVYHSHSIVIYELS